MDYQERNALEIEKMNQIYMLMELCVMGKSCGNIFKNDDEIEIINILSDVTKLDDWVGASERFLGSLKFVEEHELASYSPYDWTDEMLLLWRLMF